MEQNTMSIDKKDPIREASDESMDSTPEADIEVDAGTEVQEVTSVQKRKGGRKPVSKTHFYPATYSFFRLSSILT